MDNLSIIKIYHGWCLVDVNNHVGLLINPWTNRSIDRSVETGTWPGQKSNRNQTISQSLTKRLKSFNRKNKKPQLSFHTNSTKNRYFHSIYLPCVICFGPRTYVKYAQPYIAQCNAMRCGQIRIYQFSRIQFMPDSCDVQCNWPHTIDSGKWQHTRPRYLVQ